VRIVVIVGGSSDPSNSEFLADSFAEGLLEAGAQVEKILLRELAIADFTIKTYDPAFVPEADFRMVQEQVQAADALVFAAPVWNFGIPGNLKNLIDRFGSFSLDVEKRMRGNWKDKPFYLIFTGGSPRSAWTGLLRRTTSGVPIALQYFGGAHAGTFFEPRSTPGKGRFELVVDKRPSTLAAIKQQGIEFAALVKRKMDMGKLPVSITLKRRAYRLGQTIQRKFF
jgi:multimeric flavodoxin WrbA